MIRLDETMKLDDLKENFSQAFNDNECSTIQSRMLKVESLTSYFGSDLRYGIQILGTKYNQLLGKYQEQNDTASKLKEEFQVLSYKCLQNCVPKYKELKNKYTQECYERKQLYNELIEIKGNIRVFCRCRPLSSEEISKGLTSVVEFDPSQDSELQVVLADGAKKQFRFDRVFSPKDDQDAVFVETLPVIKSVLDGYNVCIFAYGQTGTGKTFTMEGNLKNRGVNYRALEELFKSCNDEISTNKFEISVSMLEVYNEKMRDLLVENSSHLPAKKLDIKQINGTQEVPGLIDTNVSSLEEVWDILQNGAKNRSVGSTNANELSSRSHCLVRVTVKVEKFESGKKYKSHMWLVDLAGSERVGKTQAEGERLKESQFINKSLSALGDVIANLASKSPHIPYRNSKLTHLLQSSLGGDCKTLMFTQISPSSVDLVETLCSLNFATRVRGIESGPAKKQFDPAESFQIKQMTEKLQHEEKINAKLRETLQLMQLKYSTRENVLKTLQEKLRDEEQANKNLQMKVRELESQLADEKKSAAAAAKSDHFKQPLAPIIEKRRPLSQISTNSRLSLGSTSRTSIMKVKPHASRNSINSDNKENMLNKISYHSNSKAYSMPKVRRASTASLPSPFANHTSTIKTKASKNSINSDNKEKMLSKISYHSNSKAYSMFKAQRASIAILSSSFENHTSTIKTKASKNSINSDSEENSSSKISYHSNNSAYSMTKARRASTASLPSTFENHTKYISLLSQLSQMKMMPKREKISLRTPISTKAVLETRIPSAPAASSSLPSRKGVRVQKRVLISPTAGMFGNRPVGGLGGAYRGVDSRKKR